MRHVDEQVGAHLVGDGAELWLYDADLEQVTVKPLGDVIAGTPAALLAGDNAIVVGMAAAGLPAQQRRRAIFVGVLAAAVLRIVFSLFTVQLLQIIGLLLGAVGMLLVGLADDKYELAPHWKFLGQLVVAGLVAASGVRITLFVENAIFSYAVTVLWMLTLTNALNFMDNMNGLCGGVGAIGAFFFALIAAAHGEYLVAITGFLMCGALLGFLPWNFPHARAFLGDAGSHLVGYLLAVMAILPHFYHPQHPHPLAVLSPLLVLAVPLLDLAQVSVFRTLNKKPFWIGDTNHLSHRLTRLGWSRTTAVLVLCLAATLIGALACRL